MHEDMCDQKFKTCSKLLIVMGRVAELEAVPKAVARAGPIEPINLEVKISRAEEEKTIFIGNLPEWKFASDHGVDDGEDDESLGGDAEADCDQIPVDCHM